MEDRILFEDNHLIVINKKAGELVKKSKLEFKKTIKELETKSWRYSNLQHLVLYGPKGCGKEYVVENLLKKILF